MSECREKCGSEVLSGMGWGGGACVDLRLARRCGLWVSIWIYHGMGLGVLCRIEYAVI